MKTTRSQPTEPNQPRVDEQDKFRLRQQARRRQAWTLLFAIVLATVASVASAQSPAPQSPAPQSPAPQSPAAHQGETGDVEPIAWQECPGVESFFLATEPDWVSQDADATRSTTALSGSPANGFDAPILASGGAVPVDRNPSRARPAYAELVAALANFDQDADPDGWRAEVVLRDRDDRPVMMRAHATFELTPRVATLDHRRYVNASDRPIRWSLPLNFDTDGVARVKLPLRNSLMPMLGWTLASDPTRGSRFAGSYRSGRDSQNRFEHRHFVTNDLRSLIGTPSNGELRVRISVPTEGVFEAATGVFIRPSVLVDTQWPYR